MSNSILVIGESGTGKSTAIKSLPPEKTFILNVLDKPLPFRGSKKLYTPLSTDGLTGNYYSSDDPITIMRIINLINNKRLDIKYFVIDDFGYSIMNAFMRKGLIKGYDKFTEIAVETSKIFSQILNLRSDLFCFVLMHSEENSIGKTKPKTVGKMIDQYICIEAQFTYVLHSIVSENDYKFITNNDGFHMAKTPMDLFNPIIDNDFLMIANKIEEYLNDDIS